MKELRLVEMFFLACYICEEKWSDADALTAILIDLLINNLVTSVGKDLVVTEKGERALSTNVLREYEIDFLQTTKKEKPEFMIENRFFFHLRQHFIDLGLLTKVPAKFLFIKYNKTIINDKWKKIINELLEEREKIKTLLTEEERLEKKEIVLAYAFPSISSEFKKYAKKIIGEIKSGLSPTSPVAVISTISASRAALSASSIAIR
ncbi:MAG: hypothetical protein ACOX0H_00870 [Patescibacteria group bacterium]|jgi:hypothetical protein|nr:hypothetical protein [bacterium]HQC49901.1 hypothetical protein [bacterium]